MLPALARRVLAICHYDPDTLEDRGAHRCGRACYECLPDYGNQPDHRILDHAPIRDVLAELARAECRPAGGAGSRAERLAALRKRCDSRLEQRWLDMVESLGLRLPSDAQYAIPGHRTRPDFFYLPPSGSSSYWKRLPMTSSRKEGHAPQPYGRIGGMTDTWLIERWLPIAETGVESTRERTPMTPFPTPNRLHVWGARRPLVASRAAVLASLLPADADRSRFLHMLGIHGDPVAARHRIDAAKRTGEHLGPDPYGYRRAFTYAPSHEDKDWLASATGRPLSSVSVLDPSSGGGSIPMETGRLGTASLANDLNPVAALILMATVDWPLRHGTAVLESFEALSREFIRRAEPKYEGVFPPEPDNVQIVGYLWARTITCLYCDGLVPLSPNWRLAPDGTGVRLKPRVDAGAGGDLHGPLPAERAEAAASGPRDDDDDAGRRPAFPGTPGQAETPAHRGRVCGFEIVGSAGEQSPGTVERGDGTCPFPDCGRVIDGDVIKAQAQAGRMGEQLYAVVYKERVETRTKTGRIREKWVRGYRAPRPEDDNGAAIRARLAEKLPEWEAFDLVPSERVPDGNKTTEPQRYGMNRRLDLYSPRQLLCHGTSAEVFREMLDADRAAGRLDEAREVESPAKEGER